MALKGFANAALLQTGHGPLWAWIKRITNATEAASAAPAQTFTVSQEVLVAGQATITTGVPFNPAETFAVATYLTPGPAPLGVLQVSFPDATHILVQSIDPATGAVIATDTSTVSVVVQSLV